MHFIGVFANNSEFEIIRRNVEKIIQRNDIEFIHITSKNIENMKNIMFETILLCSKAKIKDTQKITLDKICSNCKYIIMNADTFSHTKIVSNKIVNCITYGLNQKSTITISSIQEEKVIIDIQRNIKNIDGNEIEMGEISINLKGYKKINIEYVLAIFSIYFIYKRKKTEK